MLKKVRIVPVGMILDNKCYLLAFFTPIVIMLRVNNIVRFIFYGNIIKDTVIKIHVSCIYRPLKIKGCLHLGTLINYIFFLFYVRNSGPKVQVISHRSLLSNCNDDIAVIVIDMSWEICHRLGIFCSILIFFPYSDKKPWVGLELLIMFSLKTRVLCSKIGINKFFNTCTRFVKNTIIDLITDYRSPHEVLLK